jgi:hypothetical protein
MSGASKLIQKYSSELSPLIWMKSIPFPESPPSTTNNYNQLHAIHRTIYHPSPSKSSTSSPITRIHTAIARSKTKQPFHLLAQESPIKLTQKFILVQTCMTRKTKRGDSLHERIPDKPLQLSKLQFHNNNSSNNNNNMNDTRSDMLVALQPRTPLEKMIHRRAIWIQRWWRRMFANLVYLKARHLQSYLRMFIGNLRRIRVKEQHRRAKVLIRRIQHKYVHMIIRHWRRIYLARVLGVRLKLNVYHRWLVMNVFYKWKDLWQIQHDKNEKTIMFFNRWVNGRRKWHYWLEWVDFIWLRKELRNFCVRRNFRSFRKFVRKLNEHKYHAIEAGRRKLENKSASIIQNAFFDYVNQLASVARNDDLSLGELHYYATIIQTNLARLPKGKKRFEAHLVTKHAVSFILRKVNKICSYLHLKSEKDSKITFELHRSNRERAFLAECECMCLTTQHKWENGKQGEIDILKQKEIMISDNFVCLLKKKQKNIFIKEESIRRGRAKRKNDTLRLALIEFRKLDPPLYSCRYCSGAFAIESDFIYHRCTHTPKESIERTSNEEAEKEEEAVHDISHGLNIQCQWSTVRLGEELAKITASDLFAALTTNNSNEKNSYSVPQLKNYNN